jgi:hypothetical protein
MFVPQAQIVHDHIQGGIEDGLVTLRLPELDVKLAVAVADLSITFPNFLHFLSPTVQ